MSDMASTPLPDAPAATPRDPMKELQAKIPNLPTPERVLSWKKDVPGGRIKLFCPDGQRVFYLRGLSGLELAKFQKQIPENAANPDLELQYVATAAAILWTNTAVVGNTLQSNDLRLGPAGLVTSLWALIENLSDFYNPQYLFETTLEL